MAILQGALVFAEREGLFNAEMRSRMNLSSFGLSEDPASALEIAWTGSVRARQRGYVGWSLTAAGNAAGCARILGDWDRIERIASELDVLGEWSSPWEFSVPSEVCVVRAFRGRSAEARGLIDRFERQFADVTDPQMRITINDVRQAIALADGDLRAAIAHGREGERQSVELGVAGESAEILAAAVEARDIERLREAVAALGRAGSAGRLSAAMRDAASGALAVLAGDGTGLSRIDDAAEVFRSRGVRWDLALTLRARAMLAPDDPGAPTAAAEARAILTELGAVTLLRGLPPAPDAAPTEPSEAQPTPAGE
jgi:hypothetical protein